MNKVFARWAKSIWKEVAFHTHVLCKKAEKSRPDPNKEGYTAHRHTYTRNTATAITWTVTKSTPSVVRTTIPFRFTHFTHTHCHEWTQIHLEMKNERKEQWTLNEATYLCEISQISTKFSILFYGWGSRSLTDDVCILCGWNEPGIFTESAQSVFGSEEIFGKTACHRYKVWFDFCVWLGQRWETISQCTRYQPCCPANRLHDSVCLFCVFCCCLQFKMK